MPSPSSHALVWSEGQQHYELQTHGQPVQWFCRGDEPAWQSWLDEHTAFAFVGRAGGTAASSCKGGIVCHNAQDFATRTPKS